MRGCARAFSRSSGHRLRSAVPAAVYSPSGLDNSPRVGPVPIAFIGVVEDDDALCSSLVDLMHSIGYRAQPFASAEALLGSGDLSSFDCIIADVHMPGMGGLNLVREFRRLDA